MTWSPLADATKARALARRAHRIAHPNHGRPWSAAESRRLFALSARHRELGSQRWSKIAKALGRTTLAVQNRYHQIAWYRRLKADIGARRRARRR